MIPRFTKLVAGPIGLLCLCIGHCGIALVALAMDKPERDQELAWAASVANANDEVLEILERRHFDRLTVKFSDRWSVWLVTFFTGDNPLVTVSVNQDGEIVEIERNSQIAENLTEAHLDQERRRESLLRELELARSARNQAEEHEILELLERLTSEANVERAQPEKRNVDLKLEDSTLPAYVLSLPEDGLLRMRRSVTEEIKVRGEFRLENRIYPIEIRLRGASTRHAAKKSYRLRFLEETPLPRKVTYLKAEPMDHTMQQEKLSCDLFREAGLPVSKCRYVNLFINGAYEGVYLDIEPVRSPFKQNEGLSPNGILIRARTFQHPHHQGPIGELRGKVGSLDALHEFIQKLNRVDRDEFEAFVRSEIDWPRVRDYLAMQVICHRSEIEADDYLFYRNPDTLKWFLIPRDHNNGNFAVVPNRNRIGEPSISVFPQTIQDIGWRPEHWFVLPSRIFNNATLRNDYLSRLEEFVHQFLLSDRASELIDANFQELLPAYPLDPYRNFRARQQDPFLTSAEGLKQFAERHGKRLLAMIERERTRTEPTLVIRSVGQAEDRPWIELYNGGTEAIRLDEYLLANKDPLGRNRSLPLRGQIGSGEVEIIHLDPHRNEEANSIRLTSGILVLARKVSKGNKRDEWRAELEEFLYLDTHPDRKP